MKPSESFVLRSEDRGSAEFGWLKAKYSFSFGDYRNSDRMGFGSLRVLNQDRVQQGMGFGTHGHRDMEIVTYVLEGVLEHKDSMGNGSQMRPGEVQLMSAGSGVTHSEFNPSAEEPLHLLQMWIIPKSRGTEPRYEQRAFSVGDRRGRLKRVVNQEGADDSLTIGQDASMYVGLFDERETAEYEVAQGRMVWLHVAEGEIALNGEKLRAGDALACVGPAKVRLSHGANANVVLWDLAAEA